MSRSTHARNRAQVRCASGGSRGGLRYLSELVASQLDRKKVERYLERLKPAQDALGAHTDLVVGLRMARDAVACGDAQAWFNVGWLTAAQSASAADCPQGVGAGVGSAPLLAVAGLSFRRMHRRPD